VVSGDFDAGEASRWIDAYFGAIPAPATAIPRVRAVEPEQTSERTFEYRAANVPLAAAEEVYHIPAAAHPDAAAIEVLETVLGAGRSSRLYTSLVYDKQVATNASATSDLREHPGLFGLRVTCANGVALADARAALAVELDRVRAEPPDEAELIRARTQIASSVVRSRQTNSGIALLLVQSTAERGDPGLVNGDLARYLAVTGDDVVRVARTYLRAENRTVVEYLPA
jgi:zinc protease